MITPTDWTRFKFEWLEQMMGDSDVTHAAARVAFWIVQHCNMSSESGWPSIKRLASLANVSNRTALDAIAQLEAAGYLEIQYGRPGRGQSNYYTPILKGAATAPLSDGEKVQPERVASFRLQVSQRRRCGRRWLARETRSRLRTPLSRFSLTKPAEVSAMPSPTQSEPPVDALPTVYPNGRSSVGKRTLIALVRFLIFFCIGVSAILAWQSYGDPVREMIASSYPQLSWLAPQAEPVPQNAPDVIELASRTASTPDQQQPNTISLDLDTVRQAIDRLATTIASSQEQITNGADRIATSQQQIARSLDRIATSQEQMTRSLGQFTADQEQMTREITKLQEIEQSNSSRRSEPSLRPVTASAPKPVSRPASKPKPISRASQLPRVP